MTEGRKDDADKPRFELLPGDALRAIAVILTFGAIKYEDRNWEKGMAWSRCYGALQRHLNAWWQGENLDAESGKSHLWHAGCCLLFLTAYEIRGTGTDDRPGKPVAVPWATPSGTMMVPPGPPIPDGVLFDHENSVFVDNATKLVKSSSFEGMWFARRNEFPALTNTRKV